ncbi:MAG: transglycosylase SLT domain-containing protein [Leptothrix ochracea]|uniref:transglycosylase SLT domain-containing protein n=1 Tax=Leptothrix ochracea TaxID=735331 RepID=UPI0034E2C4CA
MTSCFRLKPLALLMGTVLTLLSSLGTAHAAVHPDGTLIPSPIRPLLPPTLGQGLPVIPALLLRPGEDPILTSIESLDPPPLLRDPLLTVIPPLLAAPMGLMAESEPAPSPITAPQVVVSSEAMDGFFSPVDPIDPKRIPRLGDTSIHTDLWSRVRSGFGMGTMSSGALSNLVQQHEQRFTAQADLLNKALERGSRYLFHIVDEVQKRGMPTELALLPFIESAFNPQATSSARATGMWQFMAQTGRHLDLKQSMFRDDRRDVLASTRAALDYLTQLKQRFGTWPLALAAYNWGEGNLHRAIQRSSRGGHTPDLANLIMPKETRNYVPKLLAIRNVINRPQDFALTLPKLENHPYFLSVPVKWDMDVELVVHLAEMSMEEFKSLNPSLNRPVILAAGTPQVLLPFDNTDRFLSNLVLYQGELSHWTAWTAPHTMGAAEAARQTGMTEAQLCEVNVIPPRMLIKAGSTLLVARDAQRSDDNVSEHLADNAFMHLMPEAGGGRRHAAHKTSGRTRSAHLRDKRQTASAARSAKNARAHASTPVTRQLATKN